MELWDAYDEYGNMLGFDLCRGEVLPLGVFHIVVDVLVQHEDTTYLVMQRDARKEYCPLYYEASACGSVLKGETPLQGALRELKEETGIEVSELMPLYQIVNHKKQTIYYGYKANVAIEKDQITLQDGETIAYQWVLPKDMGALLKREDYVPTQRERMSSYILNYR